VRRRQIYQLRRLEEDAKRQASKDLSGSTGLAGKQYGPGSGNEPFRGIYDQPGRLVHVGRRVSVQAEREAQNQNGESKLQDGQPARPELTKGHCPKCRRYIGRGVAVHKKACKAKELV
jgi:hypothetical protein